MNAALDMGKKAVAVDDEYHGEEGELEEVTKLEEAIHE
jgi:hypothetical protein